MFVSARRPVVFAQLEHSRLAAALAAAWGSDAFDRPLDDHAVFVSAVANHDRGFALGDADPIGVQGTEMGRARWEQIARHGFALETDDPVVDHLVRVHMRALVDGDLAAEFDAELEGGRRAAGLSEARCAAAYSALLLCDWIAYDFCLEQPGVRTVPVHARVGADPIPVTVVQDGEGAVTVDPWPFAVAAVTGVIFASPASTYPAESIVVPTTYAVAPGA